MKVNKIYNEDCKVTMKRMEESGIKADVILTSPPYNTGRKATSERARQHHEGRYDQYTDSMSDEDYIKWSIDLFKHYDKVLEKDGVVLYNISYGTDSQKKDCNPNSLLWLVVAGIIQETNFTTGDVITWKKRTAIPNNASHNKLTRITEYVFVFCRKDELTTYKANKVVKSVSKHGQNFYESIYNYIEAKNNDGSTILNKATYSTDLCDQLLQIYGVEKENGEETLIYDSFMGTGTTGVSAIRRGFNYLGSEYSPEQVEYAEERILKELLGDEDLGSLEDLDLDVV